MKLDLLNRIDRVETRLEEIIEEKIKQKFLKYDDQIIEMKNKEQEQEHLIGELKCAGKSIKEQLYEVEKQMNDNNRKRQNNLIFYGIKRDADETSQSLTTKVKCL